MVQYLQGCMLESTKDQKFVNTISCWLRDDFATQLAHKIRWAFFCTPSFHQDYAIIKTVGLT